MAAGGVQVGATEPENWRTRNFAVVDRHGTEIARITKTWEGLAKTMFTTAGNHVLQIHQRLPGPLLSLAVATALTVDTALSRTPAASADAPAATDSPGAGLCRGPCILRV